MCCCNVQRVRSSLDQDDDVYDQFICEVKWIVVCQNDSAAWHYSPAIRMNPDLQLGVLHGFGIKINSTRVPIAVCALTKNVLREHLQRASLRIETVVPHKTGAAIEKNLTLSRVLFRCHEMFDVDLFVGSYVCLRKLWRTTRRSHRSALQRSCFGPLHSSRCWRRES